MFVIFFTSNCRSWTWGGASVASPIQLPDTSVTVSSAHAATGGPAPELPMTRTAGRARRETGRTQKNCSASTARTPLWSQLTTGMSREGTPTCPMSEVNFGGPNLTTRTTPCTIRSRLPLVKPGLWLERHLLEGRLRELLELSRSSRAHLFLELLESSRERRCTFKFKILIYTPWVSILNIYWVFRLI